MIRNPIGLNYIEGKSNTLADPILHVFPTSSSLINSFQNLHQRFSQLKYWKRFHSNPELLSLLYSGLLTEQDPGIE